MTDASHTTPLVSVEIAQEHKRLAAQLNECKTGAADVERWRLVQYAATLRYVVNQLTGQLQIIAGQVEKAPLFSQALNSIADTLQDAADDATIWNLEGSELEEAMKTTDKLMGAQ